MVEDKHIIQRPEQKAEGEMRYEVHVMPPEFYGKTAQVAPAAAPQKAPSRMAAAPAVAKPPAPKPMPAPPVSSPKQAQKKKARRSYMVLIGLGVFVVALFAIAGAIVLTMLPEEESPVVVDDTGDTDIVPVSDDEEEEDSGLVPALDTDSDGLTDLEERLYGTDFRNPDTDADTYLDGNEVFHRYDPLGYAPSTLLDTGSVDVFESKGEANTFSVYYPMTWTIEEAMDPGTGLTNDVTFQSATTARITITAREKDGVEFEEWYQEHGSDEVRFRDLMPILSKVGYAGYMTENQLMTYLDSDEIIYVFTYDSADESTVQFLQTFQMMVNSFIIHD